MRIIARKADYYDKVSYLFGQDPDITYHRKDIDSKDIVMRVAAYDNHCYARNYKYGNVLCDCRYKYAQRIVDWQTIIAGQYMLKVGFRTERNVKVPILELSGVLTDSERKELQRKVGAPVFTIHNAERTENPGFVKITECVDDLSKHDNVCGDTNDSQNSFDGFRVVRKDVFAVAVAVTKNS